MDKYPEFEQDFKKVCEYTINKYGWNNEIDVDTLSSELYKTLYIKSLFPIDTSVPYKLDMCWHNLILETKLYSNVQKIFYNLEHTIFTSDDPISIKNKRVNNLKNMYNIIYNKNPNAWCWEFEQEQEQTQEQTQEQEQEQTLTQEQEQYKLRIYSNSVEKYVITIPVNSTVIQLKQKISSVSNIPLDQLRIIYNRKQLVDDHNIKHYNIINNSRVDFVLRLLGC